VPSLIKYGDHKLGIALLAFGTFFTISGITLFFHKTLLRMGNLLIIAGVPMTIGPGRTAGFFLQPKKARATGFLVFGIFLVFIGWPIFGIALEIFGLLNLFGNMLPLAYTMLKQMPIVGGLLPTKKKKKKESRSRDDDDRYYQDDRYYYRDEDQGRDTGERYY
jgi:Got1/Sft2-like family